MTADNVMLSPLDSFCEMCGDTAYFVLGREDPLNYCADCAVSLLINAYEETVAEVARLRGALERIRDLGSFGERTKARQIASDALR